MMVRVHVLIDLIRSTWEKQNDSNEGRYRIDIITCSPNEYVSEPEEHLGDLICSFVSDYKPELFLKDTILQKYVKEIAARDKNYILIRIED
jgi:hypothetical protein